MIQPYYNWRLLFREAFLAFGLLLLFAVPAAAHQPVLERQLRPTFSGAGLSGVMPITDPTQASLAIYGRLSQPGEIDAYYFTPQTTGDLTYQLLVPVRVSNQDFRPTLAIIGDNLPHDMSEKLPFALPREQQALVLSPMTGIKEFYEPFSMERLQIMYGEEFLPVTAGHGYYFLVYNTDRLLGDYVIGLGTVENFRSTSLTAILKNVFLMKLGLVDQRPIPWLDIIGLFTFLAGFVIGLGAVTVIDLHGFLGIKSAYWTEATTRTHKVTKPLIWIGFSLALLGGAVLYRQTGLNGVAAFQAVLAILLFFNGLFLSFWVSPRLLQREREGRAAELLPVSWQRKIAVSFIFSFSSWWGSLFLLVWYLMVSR